MDSQSQRSNSQRDADMLARIKQLMTKSSVADVCYKVLCDDSLKPIGHMKLKFSLLKLFVFITCRPEAGGPQGPYKAPQGLALKGPLKGPLKGLIRPLRAL